jgi:hypothetical protein
MAPLEAFPAALQCWQNFYMLTGAASATLTGLMFVAVTFGSSLVTRESAATTRAFLDPTYTHFVQVLLTGCLLTVPTLGATFLGCVLLAAAALRIVALYAVFRRYQEAQRKFGDLEMSDWVVSIVLPLLCHLLILASGAGFILRRAAALTILAVAIMALLLIGIHSAWELFVWTALAVNERRPGRVEPASTSSEAATDGRTPTSERGGP